MNILLFYNIDLKLIGSVNVRYAPFNPPSYSSSYNYSYTVTLSYGGGQIFKFKNIPDDTNVSTLESGQVYYSTSDKSLKIKL